MNWVEYHYDGFADHDNPTKYENQVRQTGRFTATVWAVHLDVLDAAVERVLDAIAYADVEHLATGEYVVEHRDFPSRWVRLTVYYRAHGGRVSASHLGSAIARTVFGDWNNGFPTGDYSVTPAGNWDDVLMDTRRLLKRGDGDGSGAAETEAQGQPGEHTDEPGT